MILYFWDETIIFIIFGENVRFICSSEAIQLKTEGLSGEMKINIDYKKLLFLNC